MPESHTGVNIASAINDVFDNWELSTKIFCFTTDAGSNMITACESGGWPRVSCFGHILNNAFQDHRITRARKVCKKIVSAFSHSWKKKQLLVDAQEKLNLPKKSLISDCPRRWGLLHNSFERILEQQGAIRDVLSSSREDSHLVPTWQDIDALKAVCDALKALHTLTDILSADEIITISAVLPLQKIIQDEMNIGPNYCALTKLIKQKIKSYIDTKMEAQPWEFINFATFLDPRYKHLICLTDSMRCKIKRDCVDPSTPRSASESERIATEDNGSSESDDVVIPAPQPRKRRTIG